MVTEADVRVALDEVIHPSFGMSLIALGMVRAVRTNNEVIEVDLVMNCPGCPVGEVVLVQTHRSLSRFNGHTVRLNLLPQVWTPPWE
jgi:metal-sulfur cluster biosynthetic enzyme